MKNATKPTEQTPKDKTAKGDSDQSQQNKSVGSHKPGGDGPGTKFKTEHDDSEKGN